MTEAEMRSTENVRGEWDELGEREQRVVVPGPPGVRDEWEEAPTAPESQVTGVPGPGAEPAGQPERRRWPVVERPAWPVVSAPAASPAVGPTVPEVRTAQARVEAEAAGGREVLVAVEAPSEESLPVDPLPADDAVPVAPLSVDGARALDRLPVVGPTPATDPGPAVDDAPAVDGTPTVGSGPAADPGPAIGLGAAVDLGPADPGPAVESRQVEAEARPVTPSQAEIGAVDVGADTEAEEEIAADLGRALDAVAEAGRAAPADSAVPLDLDLGPEPGPETEILPLAVPAAGTREEPADAGRERGAAPDLRKTDLAVSGTREESGRAAVTMTVGAADPASWRAAGRRQPVISTETTAPIPVHLLFRDDAKPGTASGARQPGNHRPPLARTPQTGGSVRPAPLADPRLTERPGPALPGWAAMLAATAGTAAGLAALWWQGALPTALTDKVGLGTRTYEGLGIGTWALLSLLGAVVLFALCGLGRGRAGYASVLTLFGDYRGSVRRTGLLWISPLLLRRRTDVRLRHWRSEPLRAVDASGTALRAVVLVVWRVKDTARAVLGVADHESYLRDQVEAALARVLSQLPADAFQEDTRTLRDAEAVGDSLTRMLQADCAPVGIEVYSAQPTGIEYAPEVAAAMQRCRVAAIDAKHRDGVLTSVVDAVDDTVGRLTARGLVELDAYEHKALVRDLTVAFYTGRGGGEGA
ncbi:SPFH domain-containing protein [Streptomyces sp. NPDC048590]|uniref:SPFH domain-containing protein n=1 Tax=Streptomyces sp. NPDC048590 TaxID=3365574 RepID=UPI003721DDB0